MKLSHGFVFLKKKFSYGKDGRIVVRQSRDSITRERRKLKKQIEMVRRGEMSVEDVERSYQSWRGGIGKLEAHKTLLSKDKLYHDLLNSPAGGGRSPQ